MRVLQVLFTLLCAQGAQGARVKTIIQHADTVQTQALQVGQLVLDRYQLLSLVKAWPGNLKGFDKVSYLGKGAFGETWLAFDHKRKQNVAVKFFYRPLRKGLNAAVMLLNMMNANANEKRQLADAGMECDTPTAIMAAKNFPAGKLRFARCFENQVRDREYAHLVMQVAGTQNLEEYVAARRGSLGSSVIKRIAKMMLEGLAQMEGSFVHKDIKPANIMIYEDAEDGQVYLRFIDFGLVARENENSGVAGTPMFMPPEVWPLVPRNPRIDHRFDIYSTGETLYWLMCGKTFHEHIFDRYGNSQESVLARQLQTQNPRAFCKPSGHLTELFEIVVDSMMASAPSSRVDASRLLRASIFDGIQTIKEIIAPRPQHKPRPKPPLEPIEDIMIPAPEAPKRTFLDQCHDDKRFWFQNAVKCCLTEKYDPLREAVCRRPCGPNVPFHNGRCENQCNYKSGGGFMFSESLQCCVAQVWQTKCIYTDPLPRGDGWKWMHA